jgi:cytochrome subunit of sulfide dehydrogenase
MPAKRIALAAALLLSWCVGAGAQSPEAPPGAASCSGCHPASTGVQTPVPRLAGRDASEMLRQMQAFRSGELKATVMNKIAHGYTDPEIQAIAAWFAAQR